MTKNRVIVFRSDWLPASETFIRNQTEALTRWTPITVGLGIVPSAIASDGDIIRWPGSVPTDANRRLFQLTRYSRELSRTFSRSDARGIHAHFGSNGVLVEPTARRNGLPIIVTFHGVDTTSVYNERGLWGRLYRRRLKSVFENSPQIIAVSESVRRRLLSIGAPPERTCVLHTGVLPVKKNLETHRPRNGVLFVGRLVEKKGVDDLIDAMQLLDDVTPLTIVGTGPLESRLRAKAAALNGDVKFLGTQNNDRVRDLMARAQVVCVPSRVGTDGDVEGLPTVIMEAGAEGTPVVATHHGGNAEAVIDGETGFLVGERDVVALARAIKNAREGIGASSRTRSIIARHFAENFNINKQTQKLEGIYDQFL